MKRLAVAAALVLASSACTEPVVEVPTAPVVAVAHVPVELGELSEEAIAMAPTWVQDDLIVALQGIADDDLRNEYARLIVDVEDLYWIDEIAFTIAHTSPEVLLSGGFHPELLTQNVQLIYERDLDLEFVELVDVGEPGVDADYHTTTRYQVGEYDADSDETSVEELLLERDSYYWYVVHPRGEDERPAFINPDVPGSPPTTADAGYFWRDYLWFASDDDCPDGVGQCPVLGDMLEGVDLLWERRYGNSDANGAMGAIIQWVNATMHFGALEERSVQPVRIYELHHGNCGEHGDITNAAVRLALIPGIVIEARGNDHCWSEFRDDSWTDTGWVQVEPVNNAIDYYGYYADGDGNYKRTRNGLDDDCDGTADDVDQDTDGDGDGWTIADGDCHDGNAGAYPGAVEVNNALDDDCDGIADNDLDPAETDADGDGFSVSDGDCDDLNAETYPGAPDADVEEPDGRDNDCDGVADDGLSVDDADGDGFSIAAGDCDDTRAAVHPEGVEIPDGRDNDCDGVADAGLEAADRDRDGDSWTVVGGDCDDTRAGTNPDGVDPMPSSNRLFGLTGGRGDALVLNRTAQYVNTFELVVNVTDDAGLPVDGALVWIIGWSTTYAQATGWWPVTEMVTDATGVARMDLGYANEYAIRVDSNIGGWPAGEDTIRPIIDEWPDAGDVIEYDVTIPGAMPAGADVEDAVDLGGAEADFRLSLSQTVTGHRVAQKSRMLHDTFSLSRPGGVVEMFVVDQWGYERFVDDRGFAALGSGDASGVAEASVEISDDRDWYVVVANTHLSASTVLGDLSVSVEPLGDVPFEVPVELDLAFHLGPGQHVAVHIARPVTE